MRPRRVPSRQGRAGYAATEDGHAGGGAPETAVAQSRQQGASPRAAGRRVRLVHRGVTEGFGTAGPKDAKALLKELSAVDARGARLERLAARLCFIGWPQDVVVAGSGPLPPRERWSWGLIDTSTAEKGCPEPRKEEPFALVLFIHDHDSAIGADSLALGSQKPQERAQRHVNPGNGAPQCSRAVHPLVLTRHIRTARYPGHHLPTPTTQAACLRA